MPKIYNRQQIEEALRQIDVTAAIELLAEEEP